MKNHQIKIYLTDDEHEQMGKRHKIFVLKEC